MRSLGILEYDDELASFVDTKTEIEENSRYEVEIRSSMIVVIHWIWKTLDKRMARIHINDFFWSKGQDQVQTCLPYHLTRTTSY